VTFEERLASITEKLEVVASMQITAQQELAEFRKWNEEAQKRHEEAQKQHEDAIKRHGDEIARMDAKLNRAIRLAIQETRNERKRRKAFHSEFDEKMTQLSAAQLITEEKLQRFIESLRRGGNGQGT